MRYSYLRKGIPSITNNGLPYPFRGLPLPPRTNSRVWTPPAIYRTTQLHGSDWWNKTCQRIGLDITSSCSIELSGLCYLLHFTTSIQSSVSSSGNNLRANTAFHNLHASFSLITQINGTTSDPFLSSPLIVKLPSICNQLFIKFPLQLHLTMIYPLPHPHQLHVFCNLCLYHSTWRQNNNMEVYLS